MEKYIGRENKESVTDKKKWEDEHVYEAGKKL